MQILRTGVVASCQKLGIILMIKLFKNYVIKNVKNKKCAPKLVVFNEKKLRKIFDKADFISQILAFLDPSPLHQDWKNIMVVRSITLMVGMLFVNTVKC